ncbi:hypothetical protein DFH29DRAFT_879270 [Suillus ampliporus]|nr:hypothetical protein DFH29DRAFT_879270 [Suillus ampliporus]
MPFETVCSDIIVTLHAAPEIVVLMDFTLHKCFKSAEHLLQHLNQPSSRCYNWNDNLVCISWPPLLCVQVSSPPILPYEDTFEDTTVYTPVNSDIDTDVEMGGPSDDRNPDSQVEVYSDADKTWGIGKTFMNQFNEDEYAVERAQNRYFPFTSKPDWETAAFLLLSDLSMVDIDEYLNLEFTKTLPLSFESSREL